MKGLTLFEVLVCCFLLSVFLLMVFSVFSVGNTAYYTDIGLLELQQKLRRISDLMSRELRQARAKETLIDEDGGLLTFSIPVDIKTNPPTYSQSISYYRNSNNQIIREHPESDLAIIATNITRLQFLCCDYNGCSLGYNCSQAKQLEVRIEAQTVAGSRLIRLSRTERVTLRNDLR